MNTHSRITHLAILTALLSASVTGLYSARAQSFGGMDGLNGPKSLNDINGILSVNGLNGMNGVNDLYGHTAPFGSNGALGPNAAPFGMYIETYMQSAPFKDEVPAFDPAMDYPNYDPSIHEILIDPAMTDYPYKRDSSLWMQDKMVINAQSSSSIAPPAIPTDIHQCELLLQATIAHAVTTLNDLEDEGNSRTKECVKKRKHAIKEVIILASKASKEDRCEKYMQHKDHIERITEVAFTVCDPGPPIIDVLDEFADSEGINDTFIDKAYEIFSEIFGL